MDLMVLRKDTFSSDIVSCFFSQNFNYGVSRCCLIPNILFSIFLWNVIASFVLRDTKMRIMPLLGSWTQYLNILLILIVWMIKRLAFNNYNLKKGFYVDKIFFQLLWACFYGRYTCWPHEFFMRNNWFLEGCFYLTCTQLDSNSRMRLTSCSSDWNS